MRAANGRPNILTDPEREGFHAYVSLPPDPLSGKRRRKHVRGTTCKSVLRQIDQIESDRDRASISSDMTFQTWAYYWLQVVAGRLKTSTWDFYRTELESHLIPHLGRLRIKTLTTEHIEEALARAPPICRRR